MRPHRRPGGEDIGTRSLIIQRKTGRPVQFEILEPPKTSLLAWLNKRGGSVEDYTFPSRLNPESHLSTRQYGRLVDEWVTGIGLRPQDYGTHSLRRTKASMLQADGQPSCRSDLARPCQDREHRAISRC